MTDPKTAHSAIVTVVERDGGNCGKIVFKLTEKTQSEPTYTEPQPTAFRALEAAQELVKELTK